MATTISPELVSVDTTLVALLDNTTANTSTSLQVEGSVAFSFINVFVLLPLVILLMLLTIGGNLVVMVCVRVDKRLAAAFSSYYVFSMAAADAVVGLLVMGGMAVYTVYGYWPLGNSWCASWVSVDYSCCTVSMLHLCLIAFDRYEAVVKPIHYRQTRSPTNSARWALIAWVVGVMAWMPPAVIFAIVSPLPENDCFYFPNPHYVLVQAVIVYWGPIAIMSVLYVKCLQMLRHRYAKTVAQAEADASRPCPPEPSSAAPGDGETEPGDGDAGRVVAQVKLNKQLQQQRSIRTLGVVMGLFLFCWIPFCLFWPIMAYCPTCINFQLFEYSYWMTYVNSGVNPFLYFISNRDFRSAFMLLVGRRSPE